MDLTDITITPMIPVGIGVVPVVIKAQTGWGWAASIGVGIIPGAVVGFVAGLLLFWTVSGIGWIFLRLCGRRNPKRTG